ncbi:MAG: putative Fe-S cluster-containing radical SAM superfamily protein [Candidatus Azotimanducaceae bacterium]|jgi:uncharacterized Fe-S cluster-containing radical SAM superfamily protein
MKASQTEEYSSCEWIEGGLSFNRRSLHSCLIVHHERGYPKYADYNGGELPVDELLQAREIIKATHKAGKEHPACQDCPHLEKKKWPQKEYKFDILGIAQYSHCNIKCSYCFLQTQPRASFADGFRPYKIADQLDQLFDNGLLSPTAIIDWGGGEPTVYQEFDHITSSSLDRGASHYLHSNGVRFPSFLTNHPASPNVHIVCSIDAGTGATYAKIKGPDYLNTVWQSLEKYIEAGCTVTLKYIVMENNASTYEINKFLKRAKKFAGICDLIIDVDYNNAESTPVVIDGLANLYLGAKKSGIACRYGFTGGNFFPESDTLAKLKLAIKDEL